MGKKKSQKEWEAEVENLVGDEYIFKEDYINGATKIKVIHKNEECGYEYLTSPSNFLNGRRCPECWRRRNRNSTQTEEDFLRTLRRTHGKDIVLAEPYKGTNKETKFIHKKCKRVFKIEPRLLLNRKNGCLECTRPYNLTHGEFLSEVAKKVKGEYVFKEEYVDYGTPILCEHIHEYCNNHEWEVTPRWILSKKSGDKYICPVCRIPLTFFDKVDKLVGEEYVFEGKYVNSIEKMWVTHNKEGCGFRYKVSPFKFIQGRRCPQCARSKGELILKNYFLGCEIPFLEEVKFEDLKKVRHLRFDFMVESVTGELILIEFDGEQHYKEKETWGGKEALEEVKENDRIKDEYCKNNNIPLVRIPYWELSTIEKVIKNIIEKYDL